MTPAGTSNELDVQNGWEENTHTHTRITLLIVDFVCCGAHETVQTVVRNQIHHHHLDADMFPMFSVGWTWQGFCRGLDPCWFE